MIIYVVQALFNLHSGMYGSPSTLGIGWCFATFSQLVMGGYILVFLGGLPGKGYRLNGLSWVFILAMYQFDLQDSLFGLKLRLRTMAIIAILHLPMASARAYCGGSTFTIRYLHDLAGASSSRGIILALAQIC